MKQISDEAVRWVVRLNSGEASAKDHRNLAAWRAEDKRHDDAFRQAEELWAAASNLTQDAATSLVKTRTRAKRRPRSPKKVLGLAGLALLTALAIWSLRGTSHDFATETAEVRTVTLPDGSRATLNAQSILDLHFTAQERRVEVIKGEVFFEVQNDRSRPFQADALGIRTTALGTAFNVKLRPDRDAVEVAVTEHAVEVATRSTREAVRITENQQVSVQTSHMGTPQTIDPAAVLSWRTGLLIAEDEPFDHVIDALRAYHPGWIVIAGSPLQRMRVNAVLNLRQPDVSLDALAGALPITVRHVSRYLTIVTPR